MPTPKYPATSRCAGAGADEAPNSNGYNGSAAADSDPLPLASRRSARWIPLKSPLVKEGRQEVACRTQTEFNAFVLIYKPFPFIMKVSLTLTIPLWPESLD